MLYHCGVLDTQPSPKLLRINIQQLDTLPPDLAHELDVCLITPGFYNAWWNQHFKRSPDTIGRARLRVDPSLRAEAIANFHSITRDDAIRLSQFRGSKPTPVKLQIMSDISAGMKWTEAQKLYNISERTLANLLAFPQLSSSFLPDWFKATIPAA